ncbi:MAG: matrixin family metalloprotease [Phycisphaerales bacterium]|nr:matrixin family metalloprotease [Phycisphaerales bacterium]
MRKRVVASVVLAAVVPCWLWLGGCASNGGAPGTGAGTGGPARHDARMGEDPEIERLLHTDRPWLPSHPPEGSSDVAPFAACFDPDFPPSEETVARVNALIRGSLAKYDAVARWTSTSTNGGVSAGQPVTLRVSLVPDTVQAPDLNGVMGASTLFSSMDSKFGGNRGLWISKIQEAFNRWGAVTGVSYVWVTAPGQDWDDGAGWNTGGSATRGDVRIAMRSMDGPNGVLAFNSYPNDGDMVLDSGENWQSSSNNYRFLRNIVMHEHGHGLGLAHVCPIVQTKLMEPNYTPAFDGPQQDDLRGVHFRYGDVNEPNNSPATATEMGTVSAGQTLTIGTVPAPAIANGSMVSLGIDGDTDWYRFEPSAAVVVSATVTPLGSSYDSTVQSGGSCPSGSPVNALTQADIAVAVVAGNGTTVLGTAAGGGAGVAETDASVLVAGGSPFFVKVYETGAQTQSQMYRLTVTVGAATSLSVSNGTQYQLVRLSWTAVPGATSYQVWRSDSANRLAATPIGTTADLTFDDADATPGQVYTYWLRAGQGANAMVDVAGPRSGWAAACRVDLGAQGGVPGADGALDNNDFIVFVNDYFSGNPRADFGGTGGLPTPDGVLDSNDFIAYIGAFFAGCP